MKLSKWCKTQGITYKTGWNWFKEGKLPVKSYQTETGTIIVMADDFNENLDNKTSSVKECVIYSRVSTHTKKDDLNRQSERCQEFATKNGFKIVKVYKEVASGMNDKRPKLLRMLKMTPDCIIVEHKDRLTRFGFNYLEVLLNRLGIELIVINESKTDKEDLMKDLISIMTSFCGRIYGLRKSKTKVTDLKKIIND